ncbi:MAG TPA: type II toxin-antitoxin system VapC family toxin [Pyrinomonadaceae bacterium]|jgi:predicted nucleic acid-binding protein
MNTYYLDTCSLKWRYLTGTPTSDVNNIIDLATNNVYTGELTILEWSSAFAVAVKENIIDYNIFKTNESALFADIAQQKLKIFQPKRVIERARAWIEYIAVVNKRGLKSGDAIHIATVIELSSQLGQTVEFITSDRKLFNILDSFTQFKPQVNANYFAP